MDNSELLRDQVSAALWQLKEEFLMDVCRYMKCDGLDSGDHRSRTRRALIKMAESVMDQIEKDQEEDEVCQYLTDVLKCIEEKNEEYIVPEEEQSLVEPAPKKGVEERHVYTNKESPEEPAAKKGVEEKLFLKNKPSQKITASPLRSRPEPTYTLPEVTLRREFKICGQIGESGQKEKLSYLSLIRQMEMGTEKGHTETEIVEAVIRAVSPGLPLRDMLEIKRGLTLTSLLTILKGHYKVDSSTELYHQLINISQDPRETPLNFVFRAIELKDKLLWKAANEENEEQYSSSIIQRKFLRSVETGLLNDAVKFHILPHLRDVNTTDEELIQRVNEAAKVENERQEKRKRVNAFKNPKVQEVQSEIQTDSTLVQSPPTPKESSVSVAVKTVKGKETKTDSVNAQQLVEELRTEMKQMFLTVMETSRRPPGPRQREKGCQKCREEGVGENCSHCFKCGQEGHLSRGCRVQRASSGNGQGLLRRDYQ